jgi:hypothetical protein
VQNARATYIGSDVLIDVSATGDGDGGTAVVWSDEVTRMFGDIRARGGVAGGDGGLVETSGKRGLLVTARPDVGAPLGEGGLWLLDPFNVRLVAGGIEVTQDVSTGPVFSGGPVFVPYCDCAVVGIDLVEAALNAGQSVSIFTSGDGAEGFQSLPQDALSIQPGDVTIEAPILKSAGTDAQLMIRADNDVVFFDGASVTSTAGKLHLYVNAGGQVDVRAPIDTNGGNVLVDADGDITIGGSVLTHNGFVELYAGDRVVIAAPIDAGIGFISLNAERLTVNAQITTTSNFVELDGDTFVRINAPILTGVDSAPINVRGGEVDVNAALDAGAHAVTIFFDERASITDTVHGGGGVQIRSTRSGSSLQISAAITSGGETRLRADDMAIEAAVNSTGALIIDSANYFRPIDLGNGDDGALSLSGAELAFLSAPQLRIRQDTGGAVLFSAPVDLTPADVRVLSGGLVSQDLSAPITANNLLVFGSSIDLRAQNDITNFAAQTGGGQIRLSHADLLTVGSVLGFNGIYSGGGQVTLTARDVAITQPVIASGGTIQLVVGAAGRDVDFGGGDSTAFSLSNAELAMLSTSGTVSMDGGGNSLTTSAAMTRSSGHLTLFNFDSVQLDHPLQVSAGALSVQADTFGNSAAVTVAGSIFIDADPEILGAMSAASGVIEFRGVTSLGDGVASANLSQAELANLTAPTLVVNSSDRIDVLASGITPLVGQLVLSADAMSIDGDISLSNGSVFILPHSFIPLSVGTSSGGLALNAAMLSHIDAAMLALGRDHTFDIRATQIDIDTPLLRSVAGDALANIAVLNLHSAGGVHIAADIDVAGGLGIIAIDNIVIEEDALVSSAGLITLNGSQIHIHGVVDSTSDDVMLTTDLLNVSTSGGVLACRSQCSSSGSGNSSGSNSLTIYIQRRTPGDILLGGGGDGLNITDAALDRLNDSHIVIDGGEGNIFITNDISPAFATRLSLTADQIISDGGNQIVVSRLDASARQVQLSGTNHEISQVSGSAAEVFNIAVTSSLTILPGGINVADGGEGGSVNIKANGLIDLLGPVVARTINITPSVASTDIEIAGGETLTLNSAQLGQLQAEFLVLTPTSGYASISGSFLNINQEVILNVNELDVPAPVSVADGAGILRVNDTSGQGFTLGALASTPAIDLNATEFSNLQTQSVILVTPGLVEVASALSPSASLNRLVIEARDVEIGAVIGFIDEVAFDARGGDVDLGDDNGADFVLSSTELNRIHANTLHVASGSGMLRVVAPLLSSDASDALVNITSIVALSGQSGVVIDDGAGGVTDLIQLDTEHTLELAGGTLDIQDRVSAGNVTIANVYSFGPAHLGSEAGGLSVSQAEFDLIVAPTIAINGSNNDVLISGDLDLGGALQVFTFGAFESAGGTLSVNSLSIDTGAHIQLLGDNVIGTVAANAGLLSSTTQSIDIENGSALTVGTAGSNSGIQTRGGNVTLVAPDLDITAAVSTVDCCGPQADVAIHAPDTTTGLTLGGSSAGTLNLSAAELNLISTGGRIILGRTDSTADIDVSGQLILLAPHAELLTGGAANVAASVVTGSTLRIEAASIAGAGPLSASSSVTLESTSGAIAPNSISAFGIIINSATSFTSGGTLVTNGGTVAITTQNGDINLNHAVSGLSGVSLSSLGEGRSININQPVNASYGLISMRADNIAIDAAVTNNFGNISIEPVSETRGMILGGSDAARLSLSAAEVGLLAVGSSNGIVNLSSNGVLEIAAPLAPANIAGTLVLRGDAIVDGNNGGVDITVARLQLFAETGIGAGDALDTAVSQSLYANTTIGNVEIDNGVPLPNVTVRSGGSGNVDFHNTGGVTITQAHAGGGSVFLSAESPLTTQFVSADDDIVIINGDSGDTTDTIQVNGLVLSSQGNIRIESDDLLTINATVIAFEGKVALRSNQGGYVQNYFRDVAAAKDVQIEALGDVVIHGRVEAEGGNIDIVSHQGMVEQDALFPGFQMIAAQDINITALGDIRAGFLRAGNNIKLQSRSGAIADNNGAYNLNIMAKSAQLLAHTGIELDTIISDGIEAELTGEGDIVLRDMRCGIVVEALPDSVFVVVDQIVGAINGVLEDLLNGSIGGKSGDQPGDDDGDDPIPQCSG